MSPKTIRDIWNRRTWAHATAHLPPAPALGSGGGGGGGGPGGGEVGAPARVARRGRDAAGGESVRLAASARGPQAEPRFGSRPGA